MGALTREAEMATSRNTFGPEWALLEHICLETIEKGWGEQVTDVISSADFNWGIFIEHAVRHKLQALVSRRLISNEYQGIVPGKMRDLLNDFRHLIAHRLRLLRRAAGEVASALEAGGIPHAARKGVVLDLNAYGDTRSRFFYDVDVMVAPESIDKVDDVMRALGYEVGVFDLENVAIIPHSRSQILQYKLSPDHLPRYGRLCEDPLVKYIEVDFATSLTWYGSDYQIPPDVAFRHLSKYWLPGQENPITAFSPDFQLVDHSMHLFREAYLESSIKAGNDVSLSAFLDVALLWNKFQEIYCEERFRRLIGDLGIARPIAWVIAHTDRVWGTNILHQLKLEGLADEQWLQSWRVRGGRPGIWLGDMRGRLHMKSRSKIFIDGIAG